VNTAWQKHFCIIPRKVSGRVVWFDHVMKKTDMDGTLKYRLPMKKKNREFLFVASLVLWVLGIMALVNVIFTILTNF